MEFDRVLGRVIRGNTEGRVKQRAKVVKKGIRKW